MVTTRVKSFVWAFVGALGVLAACSSVYAGELADLHKKMVGSTQPTRTPGRVERPEQHGITEIGLERGACYGTCPTYTVIIKSDGTLRYKGEAHVKRMGEHTGKIGTDKFYYLAHFIREAGYMDLENAYYTPISDHATVYTTVEMNGKRKVIENYASSGPGKLWAIEQLIDKLMSEAQWDDEKKAE